MTGKVLAILTVLLGASTFAACWLGLAAYTQRMHARQECSVASGNPFDPPQEWQYQPNAAESALLRMIDITGGASNSAIADVLQHEEAPGNDLRRLEVSNDDLGDAVVSVGELVEIKEIQSDEGTIYGALMRLIKGWYPSESAYIWVWCATKPHVEPDSKYYTSYAYSSNRSMTKDGISAWVVVARVILNDSERVQYLACPSSK